MSGAGSVVEQTFDITNPRDWYRYVTENTKYTSHQENNCWRQEMELIRQKTPLNQGLRVGELSVYHITGNGRSRQNGEPPITKEYIRRQSSSLEDINRHLGDNPNSYHAQQVGYSSNLPNDVHACLDEARSCRSKSVDLPRLTHSPLTKRGRADADMKGKEKYSRAVESMTPNLSHRKKNKYPKLSVIGPGKSYYSAYQKAPAERHKAFDNVGPIQNDVTGRQTLTRTQWNKVFRDRKFEPEHQSRDSESDRLDMNKYILQQKSTLKLKLLEFHQRKDDKREPLDDKNDEIVFRNPTKVHQYKHPKQQHRQSNDSSPLTTTDDGLSIEVIPVEPKSRYSVVSTSPKNDDGHSTTSRQTSSSPMGMKACSGEKRGPLERASPEKPKVVNIALNKESPKKRSPAYMEYGLKQKNADKSVRFSDDGDVSDTDGKIDATKVKRLEVFGERGANGNTNGNSNNGYDPRFYPPCYKYDRFCSQKNRRLGSFRISQLLESVPFPKRIASPIDDDVEITFENGMVVIKSKHGVHSSSNNNAQRLDNENIIISTDDDVIDIDGRYLERGHTTSPVNEEGVSDELYLELENRLPDVGLCMNIRQCAPIKKKFIKHEGANN